MNYSDSFPQGITQCVSHLPRDQIHSFLIMAGFHQISCIILNQAFVCGLTSDGCSCLALTPLVHRSQSEGQANWESLISYRVPENGGKSELELVHF